MVKKYIFLCFLDLLPFFIAAQSDLQTSISTDDGVFTISQTAQGKDMILFSAALWDDMVKGTKYVSTNLASSITVKVYVEIANKKQLHCKAGAGFRCGIFDCNNKLNNNPGIIDRTNRLCSVMLQKQDDFTIKMIFLDKVDWQNL